MATPEERLHLAVQNAEGDYTYDAATHIVVNCSDNKSLQVPKEEAARCPFIPAVADGAAHPKFPYPAATLQALYAWTAHYGDAKAVAASPLAKPCIYRDFVYVATDEWDMGFYTRTLTDEAGRKHYLSTMRAAEEYGMEGLLDFMAVALGCKLRGEKESVIVHSVMGLDKETEITADDIAAVPKTYTWFNEATKPTAA